MLQLKQTGANPRDLLETVQPTVEMFEFWAQRSSGELVISGVDLFNLNTASPGFHQFVTTVPNTQSWWVERFTITCSLLAAETISFAPVLFYGPNAVPHVVGPYYVDVITARNRSARTTAALFWAPPGSNFAFQVGDVLTGATITVNMGVRGFAVPI